MSTDSPPARRRRTRPSPTPPTASQSSSSPPVNKASAARDEDEARRDFLERNKLAARRHRERRKDYIANLERSLHITRQQLEEARQELDSLRHLATSLAQPPTVAPGPPRAYTSNNGYTTHPPPPPVPVSQPIQPLGPPPTESRITAAAARARLQALVEVFGRAVRSCDDPIPVHCDARFRDLLTAAEDAAAPIRAVVLECEELSKTCVDASS